MSNARARARHGSYIFQRPGSVNWYIKTRSPSGKRIPKEPGHVRQAGGKKLAAPLVGDHKAALLAARPRLEMTPYKLGPGEYTGPNGGPIHSHRTRVDLFRRHHPRPPTDENRTDRHSGSSTCPWALSLPSAIPCGRWTNSSPRPGVRCVKNGSSRRGREGRQRCYSQDILKHANITGYFEREARNVWALYKTLTNSKPLKHADRDDGRKLVAH